MKLRSNHQTRLAILSVIAVGAVTSALLTGPTASATPSVAAREPSTSTIDEQDRSLIDGVLFGVGPVAAQLGNNIDSVLVPRDARRVMTYAAAAREALVASQPIAVRGALEKLRSGAVNEVDEGLDELGGAFNRYLSSTYTPAELDDARQQYGSVPVVPMCGAVAVCVAAVAVAAYAAAAVHNAAVVTAAGAVVVSVVLWCGAWVGCGRSSAAMGDDRVKREKFLANATRTLVARPA